MQNRIKKIILSNDYLNKLFFFIIRLKLKKKLKLNFGKNVIISNSTICEGRNHFGNFSSITSSRIGFASYISKNTHITKTKIGKYTSIGPNVKCIFGKHPSDTFVSTHPAFFSLRKHLGFTYTNKQLFKEFAPNRDVEDKYSIVIGNDVWIGANVSIMEGVVIGDGSIVAANALVTKDVAPYNIVGGVPAKVIKPRFTEEHVNFLLKLKWWDKNEDWIKENVEKFANIENFHKTFKDVL